MFDWLMSFFWTKKKDETPEEKLQKEIDENAEELSKAKVALESSAENIRVLKNSVENSKQDVKILEVRAKETLHSGKEDEAKKIFIRLQSEKVELIEKQTEYRHAVKNHKIATAEIDKFQWNLANLEKKAQQKQIRVNLANARQKNAAFQLSQQRMREELEVAAKTAERMADLNSLPINEFEQAADAENSNSEFEKWKSTL